MPAPPLLADIFERELSFVWRSLGWSGVAVHEREDLAQEVFMVVQKLLPTYEERGALRSWLFSIVRRVAADHRKSTRTRHEALPLEQVQAGPSEEARLLARADLTRLQGALDALDATQRDVFVLYEIEGWTMADVASATKTPLQTCYSRLHAARAHIGHTFAGDEP